MSDESTPTTPEQDDQPAPAPTPVPDLEPYDEDELDDLFRKLEQK